MTEEGAIGRCGTEVRYQAVSAVLVRVGAFRLVIKLVHGQVDERGEVPVVDRVGVGVVGRQVEVLDSLHNRQCSTMVDGIGDAVVVVQQAGAHILQAAERTRTGEEWTQAGKRSCPKYRRPGWIRRRAVAARGERAIGIEFSRNPILEAQE